jgi:Ca-activated chloride channel family protein
MSCERTKEAIERFLEGESGPETLEGLEREGGHLAGCARCRADLEEARRLAEALRGALASEPPAGAVERALAAVAAEAAREAAGAAASGEGGGAGRGAADHVSETRTSAPTAAPAPAVPPARVLRIRWRNRVAWAAAACVVASLGGTMVYETLERMAAPRGATGSYGATADFDDSNLALNPKRGAATGRGLPFSAPARWGDLTSAQKLDHADDPGHDVRGLVEGIHLTTGGSGLDAAEHAATKNEELVVLATSVDGSASGATTGTPVDPHTYALTITGTEPAGTTNFGYRRVGRLAKGTVGEIEVNQTGVTPTLGPVVPILGSGVTLGDETRPALENHDAALGLDPAAPERERAHMAEERITSTERGDLEKAKELEARVSDAARRSLLESQGSIVRLVAETGYRARGSSARALLGSHEASGVAVAPDAVLARKSAVEPWRYDARQLAIARKFKEEHGIELETRIVARRMAAGAWSAFADSDTLTCALAWVAPERLESEPRTVEIEWNAQTVAVAGIRVHASDPSDLAVLRVPGASLAPASLEDAARLLPAPLEAVRAALRAAGIADPTAAPAPVAPAAPGGGAAPGAPSGTGDPATPGGKGGSGGAAPGKRAGALPTSEEAKRLADRLAAARTGGLYARGEGGREVPFPLESVRVSGEIAGTLASTLVRQRFANPCAVKIEAVYVFPLPHDAAVNEFLMEVGERRIRGIVRPREEARAVYEAARAAGKVASLLEQERPNDFAISVANIEPGRSVDVNIRFFQALAPEDGALRYVLPLVVGHRYGDDARAARSGSSADGGGHAAVTPARLAPDARLPEAEIDVAIDAPVPIAAIVCPSHEVAIERSGPLRARVHLPPRTDALDRDFVLTLSLGEKAAARIGALAHASAAGRFVHVIAAPPLLPEGPDVLPREVMLVLDSSGSMSGVPIEQCKRFVRRALAALRPEDTFDVATFAGTARLFSSDFLEPTRGNIERATEWVNELYGAGGTEAEAGIRLALEHPGDPRRVRIVVFLTDGGVSFEGDIFRRIKASGAGARVFTLGVGSSPNRHLLDGMAEAGRGLAAYIAHDASEEVIAREVDRLHARLDAPVLTDLALDCEGAVLEDVYPRDLPDLFVGRTLSIVARTRGEGPAVIVLRGRAGAATLERRIPIDLPREEPRHAALAPIWARARIRDLEMRIASAPPAERPLLEKEIERLGVDFSLASRRTSFVAVDEESETGGGAPARFEQPAAVPAGVEPEVFGGSRKEEQEKNREGC